MINFKLKKKMTEFKECLTKKYQNAKSKKKIYE